MDTHSKSKHIKPIILSILRIIGIGIFILLIMKVKPSNILPILGEIPFAYLAGIILLVMNFYFLVAYRLKRMSLTNLDYIKVLDIWVKSGLLSFITGFRGAALGAKVGFLKLKGNKVSNSLAMVSLELLYDMAFSFAVAIAFLIMNDALLKERLPYIGNSKIIAVILVACLLVLVISLYYRKNSFLREYINILSTSFKKENFLVNIILTLGIWIGNALIMFLYFRALGHQIGLWTSMAAVCIGSIVGLLSFIPSGIGVYEITSSSILSLSGIPLDSALSVTILMRFISIIIALSILVFINVFFSKNLKGAINVV